MEVDQKKMLHYLRQAAKLKPKKIFMSETRPLSDSSEFFVNTQKSPRFIMPLTRTKRIRFAQDGLVQDRIFSPGEVLFCHSNAWSSEVWDHEHTMIPIVFRDRYIRTLFIHHNGLPPDQNGPDVIYHTASPLSTAGAHLLHSIVSARKNSISQLLSFRALLQNVVETVENDQNTLIGKEAFTWDCVQDYLETNFYLDISRGSISKALHLHPATLSRLVRKRTGIGINEYISNLRMEHARRLLEENTLTVDEIADQCGYKYTSYFIRKFRQYYLESPFRYREKIKNEHRRPSDFGWKK